MWSERTVTPWVFTKCSILDQFPFENWRHRFHRCSLGRTCRFPSSLMRQLWNNVRCEALASLFHKMFWIFKHFIRLKLIPPALEICCRYGVCLVSVNDLWLISWGCMVFYTNVCVCVCAPARTHVHTRIAAHLQHTHLHAGCLMVCNLRRGLLRSSDQRAALFPALSFLPSNQQTVFPDTDVVKVLGDWNENGMFTFLSFFYQSFTSH